MGVTPVVPWVNRHQMEARPVLLAREGR